MTRTRRNAGVAAIALLLAVAHAPLAGSPPAIRGSSVADAAGPGCGELAATASAHQTSIRASVVAAGRFVPARTGRVEAGEEAAFRKLPAFCRVELTISPVAGSAIGVEVWLPTGGWNGKFQAVDLSHAIEQARAVSSTGNSGW
ncbi:MAG: hypothetical protein GEU82_18150 [Luteitalea sp.]|nr:hypothetical protein [Luteitalea sp.]